MSDEKQKPLIEANIEILENLFSELFQVFDKFCEITTNVADPVLESEAEAADWLYTKGLPLDIQASFKTLEYTPPQDIDHLDDLLDHLAAMRATQAARKDYKKDLLGIIDHNMLVLCLAVKGEIDDWNIGGQVQKERKKHRTKWANLYERWIIIKPIYEDLKERWPEAGRSWLAERILATLSQMKKNGDLTDAQKKLVSRLNIDKIKWSIKRYEKFAKRNRT